MAPQSDRTALIKRARTVLLILTLVSLGSACAGPESHERAPLRATGFIEGEQVTVASEVQGLVIRVLVARGDPVARGDLVIELDGASLRSQRGEAQAVLSGARANLDRLLAGARSEELAAARAKLEEAQAARDGAQSAVLNAQELIATPQSLNLQIEEARTQLRLAEQEVERREAELEETKVQHGVYSERGGDIARSWDLRLDAARARLAQAQADVAGAQAYLSALVDQRDNPLTLTADLHRAEGEYEQAIARELAARARLEQLEAGPTDEERALAVAQVRQAEAGVGLADARIAQLNLYAPMDGSVSTLSAGVGETAMAGEPLLTIVNLDEVTLVLYIPVDQVARVRLGQRAEVTVDAFSQRTFFGEVERIAGEAEFTPRHVQTREERVNLVLAVDVRVPNPDHALRPGMPADATLVP